MKKIIKHFYNKRVGAFNSRSSTKNGKYSYKFIFSDDNLLFCYLFGKYYSHFSRKIAKNILDSNLYDKSGLFNRSINLDDNSLNTDKSTYKNAICLIGLKSLGKEFSGYAKKLEKAILGNLYNKKEKLFMDCFADSNLLACYSLSL